MPLLSRRRRAVKLLSRSSGSRFISRPVEIVEAGDDEYSDIDDDRISNFKDVGEDTELDVIEDVRCEPIPQLSVEFVTKCRLWREVGHNSGVRGAGTSKSTFTRTKRKALDTATTALSCQKVTGFWKSGIATFPESKILRAINHSTPATTSSTSALPPTVDPLVDESPVDPVIDEDHFFHLLDQYDIFNDEKEMEIVVLPPKFTMKSAIENLLSVEANITRNKRVEKKSFLMRYQCVQGLALVRYFQLILEGVEKMKASAEVALVLYHKRGIWSYKARSIRGWGKHYLQTGITNSTYVFIKVYSKLTLLLFLVFLFLFSFIFSN